MLADAMTTYDSPRGPVQYSDKFDMNSMSGEILEEFRAGAWLHANPQRLDLGRIGLVLRPEAGVPPEQDPAVLEDPVQCLDLWAGTITSVFTYAGHQVRVTTVADPHRARVAFRIESDLIATGQAAVAVRFPYASDGFFATSDWTAPDKHTTLLQRPP
ncbi:hypothetical protein [Nonomuraea wenchangensis]|uniref:hypothetical protein n=1 Tax=Nonomuraea wenchangensis TaxID=568860 RepID=UPI0037B19332